MEKFTIFFSIWFITAISALNLLSKPHDFCRLDCAHIGCSNRQFKPRATKVFPTTPLLIEEVLKKHNQIRNELVCRTEVKFKDSINEVLPDAHFLFELKWNWELAYLARQFAMKCSKELPGCSTLRYFQRPVYNIRFADKSNEDVIEFVRSSIMHWFNSSHGIPLNEVLNYTENSHIKNFAFAAFNYQTFVGCSLAFCKDNSENLLYLNCHYSGAPKIGMNVYTAFTNEDQEMYPILDRWDGKISSNYNCLCENPGLEFSASDYFYSS